MTLLIVPSLPAASIPWRTTRTDCFASAQSRSWRRAEPLEPRSTVVLAASALSWPCVAPASTLSSRTASGLDAQARAKPASAWSHDRRPRRPDRTARRPRAALDAVPSRHGTIAAHAGARAMTIAAGTKPHPDLPRRPLGRIARSARRRQPGRPDDAGRLDLPRDRGAVRGGGRGRRRRVRGHPRRCPPTSAAGSCARSAPGIKARREELGRLIALEAGKPIRDALVEVDRAVADLPARRRGGGADDRRADPARPHARRPRTGSASPAASRSARSRRSARSTSR